MTQGLSKNVVHLIVHLQMHQLSLQFCSIRTMLILLGSCHIMYNMLQKMENSKNRKYCYSATFRADFLRWLSKPMHPRSM